MDRKLRQRSAGYSKSNRDHGGGEQQIPPVSALPGVYGHRFTGYIAG
jgi:hypothetical protein